LKITISKEDYLKTIAEAESEGEQVIPATLARWLQVSPPAVTAGIHRLKRDGLIRTARNGKISLTAAGQQIADRLLNKHHLLECMLAEVFGMEWYKVHDEAERLEHGVSEDFERRLSEFLGNGKTCPHGNIVGRDTPQDRRRRGWRTLDEVDAPCELKIVSVYERDRKLLEYLDSRGLRPGAAVTWTSRNYDETISLAVAGQAVQLGLAAARRVWVSSTSAAQKRT
jgi:DtxR family Mn-dependent transcriptional regulator